MDWFKKYGDWMEYSLNEISVKTYEIKNSMPPPLNLAQLLLGALLACSAGVARACGHGGDADDRGAPLPVPRGAGAAADPDDPFLLGGAPPDPDALYGKGSA